MAFFDDNEARANIKKLEQELNTIKGTIQQLQGNYSQLQSKNSQLSAQIEEASKRAPDFEEEARVSSEKAQNFSLTAQNSLKEVNAIKEKLSEFENDIIESKEKIEASQEVLNEYLEKAEDLKTDLTQKHQSISNETITVLEKINKFEEIFCNHPELEAEIEVLEDRVLKVKDNETKSNQLVREINSKFFQIKTLHDEILGYTQKDDDGEEQIIEGLKQELEKAYQGMDSKLDLLEEECELIHATMIENLNEFSKEYNQKSNEQFETWNTKYINLNKKIEALLPNALTAGLSHAFSQKKTDEIQSHKDYKTSFQKAIYGLIAISTIPFIISICSIYNKDSLEVIIDRVPKIVAAILPLYIPVLWLAISSSKKMNLSKRLIEEYTHKEVLSKTYEGLSKQIESIDNDDTAVDLRTKLLQNFLLMYSENPGKLISDYNNTDHPIMELLENSNKLETTVQKLENIPGLNKIAKFLENRSKKKLEQVASKVEKGIDKALDVNDEIDDLIKPAT